MQFNDIYDFQDKLGRLKDSLYSNIAILETPYSTNNVILKEKSIVNLNYEHKNRATFMLIFNETEYNLINGLEPDEEITNDVYSIGGIDFKRMGMYINKSSGYYDFTAMKPDNYTFYNKESNKINARIGRNIELEINCIAGSEIELSNNHQYLQSILKQPGLQTLIIKDIPKTFQVYNKDGYKVNKFKREGNTLSTKFKLILREPEPNLTELTLAYLVDINLNYILDVNERYIVVLWDRSEFTRTVYLFTDSEPGEPKVNLWLDSERDSEHANYNPDAEQVYLFNDEEI